MSQSVAVHRSVARAGSYVFAGVALAMLTCALMGFAFEGISRPVRDVDAQSGVAMVVAACLTGLGAGFCWFWGRPAQGADFGRREAVVTVNFIWFGVTLLGALPYMVDAGLGPADAIFESASGFTTTGATIVTDIEGSLSHTLLLWRSLTQWLGGMGIVVLFLAIFPSLGVGGKHMFRSEVPGHTAEGLQPRITETALVLWRFYLVFTLAEVVILWFLGMDLFDAVNHAWTTMASGGFSTRNDSIGAFDDPTIELVIIGFMLLTGVNFGLYYAAIVTGRFRSILRSLEARVYLGIAAVATLVVTVSTSGLHDGDWIQTGRAALFTVVSTLTSTGYAVDDYMAYPPVALLLFIGLMFVGGMSGSTAGGIKVSRFIILVETGRAMLQRSVRPNVVHVVRLDRKPLDESLQLEVATYFFLHMLCLSGGSVVIAVIDGTQLPTVFGAMLTSLCNMGPAPFHEGGDNFATYSAPAKLVFSLVMVIGRLELFTVLVLFLPNLWRR